MAAGGQTAPQPTAAPVLPSTPPCDSLNSDNDYAIWAQRLAMRGACCVRGFRTGYPIQYQWTLLEGINDTDAELEGIARLLAGKYAVMNLIPYNSVEGVDGFDYRRPSWERAAEMARCLHRRGVLTKLRHSAGQDVEGGCGQLRALALGVAVGFSPAGLP